MVHCHYILSPARSMQSIYKSSSSLDASISASTTRVHLFFPMPPLRADGTAHFTIAFSSLTFMEVLSTLTTLLVFRQNSLFGACIFLHSPSVPCTPQMSVHHCGFCTTGRLDCWSSSDQIFWLTLSRAALCRSCWQGVLSYLFILVTVAVGIFPGLFSLISCSRTFIYCFHHLHAPKEF